MPKTLLLADDSVTIQKVVGISLANEDIELVTVENGDDAVTEARQIHPDIVLADIVMPGKNGYEVCEAIKTDPNLGPTPVLLLTGTFEAFDAERARQAGADGHITKPFEAQALVDHVNQLLARSTPLGDADARGVGPPPAQPQTRPLAPPADVGAHGEGGDAFDFFDAKPGGAAAAPPSEAAPADTAPLDLLGGHGTSGAGGSTEETVLLDPGQSSGDPAFDAAVEAAAFDAPGERSSFQAAEDSGFDLETADLSMASTVPEVPVAADGMSFSDPSAAESAAWSAPEPAPAETPASVSDPLLDFDPLAGANPAADETVLDPTSVQSFDLSPGFDAARPGNDSGLSAETVMIVEDAHPVRVQAPADADTTAPVEVVAGALEAGLERSPALEQQLHAALEKIAWEAFSDLSEQVVKQVLSRVEAVAWEVIPQMAEVMVREEIAKMKGGEPEQD